MISYGGVLLYLLGSFLMVKGFGGFLGIAFAISLEFLGATIVSWCVSLVLERVRSCLIVGVRICDKGILFWCFALKHQFTVCFGMIGIIDQSYIIIISK